MTGKELQQLVADLVSSMPRYSQVAQDVQLGRFQVDIHAHVRSSDDVLHPVVFEVKKVTLAGGDLLQSERRRAFLAITALAPDSGQQ